MHKVSDRSFLSKVRRDKYLIAMTVAPLVFFIVFKYIPMGGNIIAFQDYIPNRGFWDSDWVGLQWFEEFFSSTYFFRLFRNTLLLNVYNLLWSFPVPILFALIVNELRDGAYKRTVQTISYLPHFISLTIIVGILKDLTAFNGVVNTVLNHFGVESIDFMIKSGAFRPLYISSGVWQSFGYNSIVYLAAISGIDPNLYEAASVDGARRWHKMWHITLPCILPTAIILLIMNCGHMLSVGSEKILLMYSPAIYEVSDVFSTYVYRRGILSSDFSYSTAVGLFESVVNVIMLVTVNRVSRRVSETSLW